MLWLLAGLFGGVLYMGRQKIEDTIEEMSDSWTEFDGLFKKYGLKYDVPWQWLKAIALNESSLGSHPSVAEGIRNPSNIEGSKSSDGKSWGLMQVTLATARDLDFSATAEKLNNPEYSVNLAADYLNRLAGKFSQVDVRYVEWVIKSYNQGPGNTMKEKSGQSSGFAQAYWERFQRNLERVYGGDT